jgi:hypothetical protein
MSIVLKSGSLSLLEHSGPVRACNETALPLPVLGGSGPYISTDKQLSVSIHKRNNTETQYKQYRTP